MTSEVYMPALLTVLLVEPFDEPCILRMDR